MNQDPTLHVAWLTFDATVWALVVGGIAVVVAFIALGVAITDARNNSKQLKAALARPKFTVDFEVTENRKFQPPPGTGDMFLAVRFTAKVQNIGERATNNYMISFLVPYHETIYQVDENQSMTYQGVKYLIRPHMNENHMMMYPYGPTRTWFQDERLKYDQKTLTIRWRIYDETGPNPEDDWGTHTFTL